MGLQQNRQVPFLWLDISPLLTRKPQYCMVSLSSLATSSKHTDNHYFLISFIGSAIQIAATPLNTFANQKCTIVILEIPCARYPTMPDFGNFPQDPANDKSLVLSHEKLDVIVNGYGAKRNGDFRRTGNA